MNLAHVTQFMPVIGLLLLLVCVRPASGDDAHQPAGMSDQRRTATLELAELLHVTFRKPTGLDAEYWNKHGFPTFWNRVQALLQMGADVETVNKSGVSIWETVFVADPRCLCAPYGWPGFFPRGCTNPKYFAGCYVVQRQSFDKRAAFLLEQGVDPNGVLTYGEPQPINTPFCAALNLGGPDMVAGMIAHHVRCEDPCGNTTPLHVAAIASPEKLCAVIKCGAAIDTRDRDGRSALAEAASVDSARNVAILLDYGADASIKDGHGEDAMTVARRAHSRTVVRLLARQGTRNARPPTRSQCGH